MVGNLQRYNKLWVALAIGLIGALSSYYGEQSLVVEVVTALLVGAGVYVVPNRS